MMFSDFSVIMTAMSNLADVINDLSYAVSYLREKSLYFCNLRDFLKYENKVTGGSEIPGELERIEFKNVSFTYPDSDKPAVRELDLIFTKNETTAIVGHNGAGKTTFFKLLLRFYDPDCGEILYNGVNIKEYDLEKYRSKIAAVFQDYSVFALTVEENVLCREIKTEDDRSVVFSALKNSGAEEFVQKLPKKEKTVLTREFDKDGTGLSGGEQQKLAAARMFAKNFEAAVLDEPSSALDPIAEYKMYENLIKGTAGKAVIYISHRLSSATLSDKIYLFENGTVTEKGTHGELMNLNGEYARMFALQASGYSDETEVYAE
ncbi:MAG: ABC transporter ATP-binding protein [Oscillospiraceae bacterium]|nr:ABC transporter ATP-binding protein [Oscillospiraceae bacterium]